MVWAEARPLPSDRKESAVRAMRCFMVMSIGCGVLRGSESELGRQVGAGQTFTLRIWAADARDSTAFGVLAAALYPLLEQVSAGGITLRP